LYLGVGNRLQAADDGLDATQEDANRVDCESMVGTATFADVLDRHLHVEPATYPRQAGIATASIWPRAILLEWPAAVRGWDTFPSEARSSCADGFSAPLRQLTTEQQAALEVLASAADVPLSASFDPATLKRAFRRAARRLHPDAHPDADAATRRRLETAFVTARDAYLTLLALTTN
jgi:hypothetical protein